MNLKSKIIALVIVFCVFVWESAHSQGLFKNQSVTSSESTSTNSGPLRDPPPIDLNNDIVPGNGAGAVGEGFVILSLLSGGYFMLKRKKNSQK
jgi:hypothetical protein